MRDYSAEEVAALRIAFPERPLPGGPAQYAGGSYWPDELERRARNAERLAPKLRLAAAALRREIAADPLTAVGVAVTEKDQKR